MKSTNIINQKTSWSFEHSALTNAFTEDKVRNASVKPLFNSYKLS